MDKFNGNADGGGARDSRVENRDAVNGARKASVPRAFFSIRAANWTRSRMDCLSMPQDSTEHAQSCFGEHWK